MKYDKYIDRQCVPLCDAINTIDGLKTQASCCGHNKRSFQVFFGAKSVISLYILCRVINKNYGYLWNWKVEATCVDRSEKRDLDVLFMLSSENIIGRKAYNQSKKIADQIYSFLHNKRLVKTLRVGIS